MGRGAGRSTSVLERQDLPRRGGFQATLSFVEYASNAFLPRLHATGSSGVALFKVLLQLLNASAHPLAVGADVALYYRSRRHLHR